MEDDSILNSTKKLLGIAGDYTAFDLDILTHINTAFSTLQQLGVGPSDGFMIEGADEKWVDFLKTNKRLNPVRTYIALRVRLVFDPPTSVAVLDAMKQQREELEWRLQVAVDIPSDVGPNQILFDGGRP